MWSLLGLAVVPGVSSQLSFDADIADVEGQGWVARGIAVHTVLKSAQAANATLSIKRIELPHGLGLFRDVEVRCPQMKLIDSAISCAHGTARLTHPEIGDKRFLVAFDYQADRRLKVSIAGMRAAGGWKQK